MKYCPQCHALYPTEFEFCPNDNSAVVPQGLWTFLIAKGFQTFRRNSPAGTKAISVAAVVLLLAVSLLMFTAPRSSVPVEFKTTPLGTTVQIKSTGQECVTPYCSIKLRPGKHEMEFSHPGYTKQTQIISVQAKGQNTFPIVLRELPAVASNEKLPSTTTTAPRSRTKPPAVAMARRRFIWRCCCC
jgi:hypothetical protein